jgi:hypothetical protein
VLRGSGNCTSLLSTNAQKQHGHNDEQGGILLKGQIHHCLSHFHSPLLRGHVVIVDLEPVTKSGMRRRSDVRFYFFMSSNCFDNVYKFETRFVQCVAGLS